MCRILAQASHSPLSLRMHAIYRCKVAKYRAAHSRGGQRQRKTEGKSGGCSGGAYGVTYLEGHHEVSGILGLVGGQVLQHLGERAEELEHALLEGRPVLLQRERGGERQAGSENVDRYIWAATKRSRCANIGREIANSRKLPPAKGGMQDVRLFLLYPRSRGRQRDDDGTLRVSAYSSGCARNSVSDLSGKRAPYSPIHTPSSSSS